MRYVSTRGEAPPVTFSDAMVRGLAPDGGLYVPDSWPTVEASTGSGLHEVASLVIGAFLDGDPLATSVDSICKNALSFPIPIVRDESGTYLELFHGPTAAFKDVGARFLAECFDRLEDRERTILVATSGDTGSAVASAFSGKPGIDVGILFPRDGVAARQRHQLTCWGGNVRSLAVTGTFDDCQALLKQALADPRWRAERKLTTANSINIGRLLPQVVYYAYASRELAQPSGSGIGVIVPSGNVGNATAALWAKRIGFPIREVVMALNSNATVDDYLASGEWRPRPSVETLANAMDVGNPSNMERIFSLYPDVDRLRRDVRSFVVDDATIREVIRSRALASGRVLDPHTAVASQALGLVDAGEPWLIVATAHPAKFETIVEPLIGRAVELPPALAEQLARPSSFATIAPSLGELEGAMSR